MVCMNAHATTRLANRFGGTSMRVEVQFHIRVLVLLFLTCALQINPVPGYSNSPEADYSDVGAELAECMAAIEITVDSPDDAVSSCAVPSMKVCIDSEDYTSCVRALVESMENWTLEMASYVPESSLFAAIWYIRNECEKHASTEDLRFQCQMTGHVAHAVELLEILGEVERKEDE